MLMQVGSVTFEVQPFNIHQTQRSTMSDFARKDVVGAMRPLEFMGEGEESIQLMGKLLPYKVGGLEELAALHAMREQGKAQYVMRGDGRPMGWYVIEQVDESSEYLSIEGIGQTIDFTIYLVRAPSPAMGGGGGSLTDLFSLLQMMLR